MNNRERLEFLKGKPRYNCRIHPTDFWHEVGCSHKVWTVDELQRALDNAKRSNELNVELINRERLQALKTCYKCFKSLIPYDTTGSIEPTVKIHTWYCPCTPDRIISIG